MDEALLHHYVIHAGRGWWAFPYIATPGCQAFGPFYSKAEGVARLIRYYRDLKRLGT